MHAAARVLVLAATSPELAPPGDWIAMLCGVGPVEAAAATARAIAEHGPDLILHVGIAGARTASGIALGSLVIGTEARYCDLGVPAAWAPRVVEAPVGLVTALRRALPDAFTRPIGTSGRVGGTAECDVEAMEGFGVLRAAQLAGVPAIEVRAISNHIEEPDRTRWRIEQACQTIAAITPALVTALRSAP
jgi:futalosine hydrolase